MTIHLENVNVFSLPISDIRRAIEKIELEYHSIYFLHFSGLKLSAVNVLISTLNPSEGLFSFRLTKKTCLKICYSSAMLSVKKHRNFSHCVKFNFNVPDYPSDFYKNLVKISLYICSNANVFHKRTRGKITTATIYQ
jgi:hypothetical protein